VAGGARRSGRVFPVRATLAATRADSEEIMKVYLAAPRGFCAGVDRAIEIVEIALRHFGAPVYVKHAIVHNPHVVRALEAKGAVTVEDVEDIPEGSNVVFSAHGSPPEDFAAARERGLNVIDATCPLVVKVHSEAKKYDREGRRIILVGHRGHQEVQGTVGQAPMFFLDDSDGDGDAGLPSWDVDTEIAVLTQTTLSVDDTRRSVETIRGRFANAVVRDDICYATTNRQDAVKALCGRADLILVLGSQSSSNCNRLREVAEARGTEAHLIGSVQELDRAWLRDVEAVGITSGASTPDHLVHEMIDELAPDEVEIIKTADENVSFTLPRSLVGS